MASYLTILQLFYNYLSRSCPLLAMGGGCGKILMGRLPSLSSRLRFCKRLYLTCSVSKLPTNTLRYLVFYTRLSIRVSLAKRAPRTIWHTTTDHADANPDGEGYGDSSCILAFTPKRNSLANAISDNSGAQPARASRESEYSVPHLP